MKLFFASDLHGSLPATEKVLELYRASGAQYLVLLGDILNHGPRNPIPEGYNPPAVAEKLNELSQEIIAVRGNCDSEVDQMLLSFPMMMDYSWVLLESGQRIFLTHGHLYNTNKRPALKAGDIIAHGHTHIPVAEYQDGIFIFNPSSATFPRNDHAASYGLYENGTFKVVSLEGDQLVSGQL
ncbi:phosphodiesterase [Vibrio lentus]|uniref:phosphodiesterase n=1 Tax=Vibrio lentus TaxID=136468 RepID=UPI000C8676E9|nr:phosphodiesterase [Vibrio lentus]PMI37053.1 YfcE family phosphodiesterase [Vibrio lentus]PMI62289.1 YfcE family phosphodiesterase [Vibrio lentus]PMJ55390.1 YfcE family phosphodiesterase [Vibrio lentus]PMN01204.1 YfcE family phosphodiesterase [Vibrio lentus]